jgi:hypothetical protein
MALCRKRLRPAVFATATVLGATAFAGSVRDARADDTSTVKGVVGGSLLGADVVTIVESVAGVRPAWAYGIGALVGAAGGGVGGYFIGRDSSDGRAPTYILAGGLALIIPAIVLTLNATRYLPEEGATEDKAPTAPAAEPGTPGGSVTGAPPDVVTPPPAPPPATPPQSRAEPHQPRARAAAPAFRESLVDMEEGVFRLGVPVPDVRAAFSMAQQVQYGMRSETELRLPVLSVIF